VGTLSPLVAEVVEAWPAPHVETEVFGTSDPGMIADSIDAFCGTNLGSRVAEGLFYSSSVGCVSGVTLRDGRSVVVKVYQPRWTAVFLTAVARAQRHLAGAGFACPRPLAGPLRFGTGLALVEEVLPDPGRGPAGPSEMRTSAWGLAEVVTICEKLDPSGLSPHPLDSPAGELYPVPHHPVIDFEGTSKDAGWIDALAGAAARQGDRSGLRQVIAHTDWSMRNVRLTPAGVVAAYDWDSLAEVAETVAVGQAAATWCSDSAGVRKLAPSRDEVADYVKEYESARGRTFSPTEWDCIGASALWVLAYTARCEHALSALGPGPEHAIGRLRLEGDALLRLSETAQHSRPGSEPDACPP
jgi:hypothetical protein